jgi:hypothetical protein
MSVLTTEKVRQIRIASNTRLFFTGATQVVKTMEHSTAVSKTGRLTGKR